MPHCGHCQEPVAGFQWVVSGHPGPHKPSAHSSGIPALEQAILLNPRDPEAIGIWYMRIGLVHLVQSRTDEALLWLEKARGAMPAHPAPHASLASAYALTGDTERAATELAEARRLVSDDRYSSIARLRAVGIWGSGYWGVPKIRALFEATYFVGRGRAGMPEE